MLVAGQAVVRDGFAAFFVAPAEGPPIFAGHACLIPPDGDDFRVVVIYGLEDVRLLSQVGLSLVVVPLERPERLYNARDVLLFHQAVVEGGKQDDAPSSAA